MSDNLEKKSPPEGETAAAPAAVGVGDEVLAPEGAGEGAEGGEGHPVPFGLHAIPEEDDDDDDDEENSLMFIDPEFLGGALPSPVGPFDEDEGEQGAEIAVGGGAPEGGGPGPVVVVGVVHPLPVEHEPPPPNVELIEVAAAGENANDSSDEVRFLCRVPGDGKTRRVARRPLFLSDDDEDDDDEDARPIKMACNLAQILPKNAGSKSKSASKAGECSSSLSSSPFEFKQFGSGLLGMPPAGFFIPGAVRRGGGTVGGGGGGAGSSRGHPPLPPGGGVADEAADDDDEESLSDSSGRKVSLGPREGDREGGRAHEGEGEDGAEGEGVGNEADVDVEADDEESLDEPPSA